jgi:hypothetical protein
MKRSLLPLYLLVILSLTLNFWVVLSGSNYSLFKKAQVSAPIFSSKNQEEIFSEKVLSEISSQFSNLEASFKDLKKLLIKIQESFEKNLKLGEKPAKEVKDLKEMIAQLEKKLSNLEKQNKEIETTLLTLQEKVQAISNEPKKEASKINKETEEEAKVQLPERLLITEVSAGFDSSENEFIEIYNPNDFPVKIDDDNFLLEFVNSKNTITQKRIEWKRNVVPPKGFFLFLGGRLKSDGKILQGDAYFSPQLTSIGGVIIRKKEGEILDKVGWGKYNAPIPVAGTELKAKLKEKGLQTGESLQRKKKNLEFIDTNNNENDFEFSLILTPQNSLGEKLVYTKTLSKQLEALEELSGRDQESLTIKENLLITEIQIQENEFVELFNPEDTSISLKDKYLVYFSSNRSIDNPYRVWQFDSNLFIPPKTHFLIGIYFKEKPTFKLDWQVSTKEDKPYRKSQLAQNGAIGIFSCNPKREKEKALECKIDLVGWGKVNVYEKKPVESPKKNQSLLRKIVDSSYQDTQNNFNDFFQGEPTPGF